MTHSQRFTVSGPMASVLAPSMGWDSALSGLSIDQVAEYCQQTMPHLFVYRGGTHVAVHLADSDPQRMILIVEVQP